MDHGLRSEWQTPAVVPAFDWIRSPRRQFEISLGAALATRTRGSARVRSPTSSWAINTTGLPAWPNCSPTARQSLALPLHNRDNFGWGRALRSRVWLPAALQEHRVGDRKTSTSPLSLASAAQNSVLRR